MRFRVFFLGHCSTSGFSSNFHIQRDSRDRRFLKFTPSPTSNSCRAADLAKSRRAGGEGASRGFSKPWAPVTPVILSETAARSETIGYRLNGKQIIQFRSDIGCVGVGGKDVLGTEGIVGSERSMPPRSVESRSRVGG